MKLCVFALLASAALAQQPQQPQNQLPDCPDGPVFSVLPFALEDFLAFRPLGFVSLPVHLFPAKHSAFVMALPGDPTPVRQMRFPGDMWVTEIWSTAYPSGGSGYQLYYQPCRQMRGYFNHLGSLSDRLKAIFDAAPSKSCYDFNDQTGVIVKCSVRVFEKVLAGEHAGASGDGTGGVDFGLSDMRRKPEGLAVLEHYPFDYPYYVSPFEYFPDDVKSQFEPKLTSWDGQVQRTAEPRWGTFRPDIVGTAQGNWFRPGIYLRDVQDYSPSLALVSDYIDPAVPIIAAGLSLPGVRMAPYSFTPQDDDTRINAPFRKVTADGNVYCYDRWSMARTPGRLAIGNLGGILLLSMPDPNTLLVEKQTAGTCAESQPWQQTEAAVRFER
ncbi:MAG: hypothetical protein SGI92_10875 [Bryobacteraceae bacterium]|nr:hypothetical protein [Bryobacteraceae bacterium]